LTDKIQIHARGQAIIFSAHHMTPRRAGTTTIILAFILASVLLSPEAMPVGTWLILQSEDSSPILLVIKITNRLHVYVR
jgi:hypothetical protein